MREALSGIARCALLGVCAAALEMVWDGLTLHVQLGVAAWVALAVAVAAVDAAWFGLLGLGASVLLLRKSPERALPAAHQLAVTALLGSATFLLPAALEVSRRGNGSGAVVFGALPIVALLFTYFASRWALRRAERGEGTTSFPAVALGAWAVASVLAPLLVGVRAPIGDPVDPRHVVLVTVDGLAEGDQGPGWKAFADEGVSFGQAVAATPEPHASNASVLVGLHPLRDHVVDPRDTLEGGYTSAFEELRDAGYATGAFLSSPATASGTGLEQGFGTYDDAFLPPPLRATLVSRLLGPSGRRPAGDTVAAFEAWTEGRDSRPFAAWIHLDDDPRAVDAALGRLREVLAHAGGLDRTYVVLVGTGGPRGDSGLPGIGDDRVHVPLALRTPQRPQVAAVDAQVRLVDVANTLLDAVELPVLDQSEGVALGAYGTGLRKASMNATVLGRDDQGRRVLGVRNNGLKFAVLADGSTRLYDLARDPREQHDLSAEQPKTVSDAKLLLSREKAALDALGDG